MRKYVVLLMALHDLPPVAAAAPPVAAPGMRADLVILDELMPK